MADLEPSNPFLVVQRFQITISFVGSGAVSGNWGPTLRGGFGHTLRKIACPFGRDTCEGCCLGSRCAYAYLFETPVFADSAVMRKYPEAPHPFIFEPPPPKNVVQHGEKAQLGLVLVGRAVELIPYIYLALEELGRQGLGRERVPFRVEQIAVEDGAVVWSWQAGRQFHPPDTHRLSLEPGPSRQSVFQIRFSSPTRIVTQGQLSRSPQLLDLVKALARRAFLLRYFHCGGCLEPIAPEFFEAASQARILESHFHWEDWERFSGRQKRHVPLGGLMGNMVLEADFGRLKPLLRAGEYVHVGKNTTFGLGKLTISEENSP
jgi:hypothetical protein